MLLRFALFGLGAFLVANAEPAGEPRQPAGKWVVDFAAAQCLAHRDYGTPEDPLRLVLKAPPLGNVMQVAVVREGKLTWAEQAKAVVTIDERGPLRTNLLMSAPKGGRQLIYLLNMTPEEFAPVRQAKQLGIRSDGLDQSFALSDMEPLLKVMERCAADLRRVWNIAEDGSETAPALARRAESKAPLAKYIDSTDFPLEALDRGLDGRVKFALLIDEAGKVADCTILQTSGVAALDGQACAAMRGRAKFNPALGKDGKPAKDASIATIHWKIAR